MSQVEEASGTKKSIDSIGRPEVEDFLYLEADLIDRWDMDGWLELYAEDAHYFVPTTDLPSADPKKDLVYINHDYERIRALAKRLKSSKAYREYPYSNVRHLVTNVRLLGVDEDGNLRVSANFLVWRFRNEDKDHYVGQYDYRLKLIDGELKIQSKQAHLSHETLRPAGAISIIL
jgi:p-cumate 2,3-dioxygenase beta subunit